MIFRIRMLLIMMNIVHLYSRVTCSSLEKNAFIFPASSRRSASLVAALFSRGSLAPVSSSSDDMTTMVTWLIAAPEGPGQASRSALAAPQSAAGSLPRAPREASQSAAGSLPAAHSGFAKWYLKCDLRRFSKWYLKCDLRSHPGRFAKWYLKCDIRSTLDKKTKKTQLFYT